MEGSALVRATRPFAEEDPVRSLRLFVETFGLAALLWSLTLLEPLGPLRWFAALALGLVNVRIFIFYHDYLHGAVFRGVGWFGRLMSVYGLLILTPTRIWKDSHNYHHAHTSSIVGSSIGSYPILTIAMYRACTPAQRLAYRLARHPLTILFGYFTIFLFGMCLRPLFQQPKRHAACGLSLLVHFGLLAGLYALGGAEMALLGYGLPLFVSCAAGSYLFYAQHNFPEMVIYDRRDWAYDKAALHSSSMMSGGPLFRWITGDIGFHHVHHLSSLIPFYRLEEAMKAMPELAAPGRTTLRPSDVFACLRLDLWDPRAQRMVSFAEVSDAGAVARPET